MFIKIKKSLPFKVLLIISLSMLALTILIAMFTSLALLIYASFGMWRPKNYISLSLPINKSYYSIENINIDITSLNENDEVLFVTYSMDIVLNKDIKLQQYNNDYNNDYEITSITVNNNIIPLLNEDDSQYYEIKSNDKLQLKIYTKYNVLIDVYKDYKCFIVENLVNNSTLSIPEGYNFIHVNDDDILQNKNKKIIIACPGSSLNYTRDFHRLKPYKLYKTFCKIDMFYFPFVLIFVLTVFIGSSIEKKKAKKTLAS